MKLEEKVLSERIKFSEFWEEGNEK